MDMSITGHAPPQVPHIHDPETNLPIPLPPDHNHFGDKRVEKENTKDTESGNIPDKEKEKRFLQFMEHFVQDFTADKKQGQTVDQITTGEDLVPIIAGHPKEDHTPIEPRVPRMNFKEDPKHELTEGHKGDQEENHTEENQHEDHKGYRKTDELHNEGHEEDHITKEMPHYDQGDHDEDGQNHDGHDHHQDENDENHWSRHDYEGQPGNIQPGNQQAGWSSGQEISEIEVLTVDLLRPRK